jgi:O-antigen/teichoic acid export membrane protein
VNILGVVVVGIMTRSLGLENFGHYSTIMAYLYIFSIAADMGLYAILVREISQHDEDENRITGSIFSLRLILIFLFVLIAVVLVWFLPYPNIVKLGVLVASLYVIFSSLIQILIGIFQKHLRVYVVSIADIVARSLQLILLLFLIYLGKAGLMEFLAVVVVSVAAQFIILFIYSKKLANFKLHIDVQYWKTILRNSFPIAVSLVFSVLYFKIDTLLISLLRGADEVGIYSVAYKVLELVIFVPAMYIGLVFPILSKYAGKNKNDFVFEFKKTFDVIAIMAMPTAVYLFIMAHSIVRAIGGDAFFQSGAVLQVLVVAITMIFFGNLGGHSIIALNLQKKSMWIYIFGAILNIATNLIFIPKYGYIAAAWTTVATEIFVTICMFILISKKETGELSSLRTLKALLSALLMGLIILPFSESLIIGTLLGISYIPILWLARGFTTQDVKDILSYRSIS